MCCEFYEQIHVNTTGSGVKPGKGQGAWQHRGIFSLLLIAKHSAMAIYPCWEGCDMPGLGTISMEQWVLCLSDCQFHLQTVFFFFFIETKREAVCILLPAWAICHRHLGQCSYEQHEEYFDQLQPTRKSLPLVFFQMKLSISPDVSPMRDIFTRNLIEPLRLCRGISYLHCYHQPKGVGWGSNWANTT